MKYTVSLVIVLMVLMSLNCGPSTKMQGLVEVASIYGFIMDESRLPINLAEVTIAGDKEYTSFTNEAGYFIFDDLAPGTYNIIVIKSGYNPQNLTTKAAKGELNELTIIMEQSEMKQGQVSGMVVDYTSREPLVVDVTLTDLGMSTSTDSSGKFIFKNLVPKTYLLKFQAMHYITSHTDVTVLPDETAEVMISLIRGGTVITLEGIQFEFGKAKIKPESSPVLDKAAAILTNHPEIEVEIQGHTDSIGTAEANRKLSQARAEAVRDYLIDVHMIEPVRLIPIGYGESQPVADNATEAGRAKNRRVDFVVLEE